MSATKTEISPSAKAFTYSRVFDAPQDLIWSVWTEPKHMAQWWGPKGFTASIKKLELRVGGLNHYCLIGPDGSEMWGKFVYREISPKHRILLVSSFSDKDENITRHPMAPIWPAETLTTFAMEKVGDDKTKVSIHAIPINASEEEIALFNSMHASMNGGWGGTFDQLADYLKQVEAGK